MDDLGFGQRVQISEHGRPGGFFAERGDLVIECLLQHQSEERTEHMAADGLVELVEDGPRGEQGFCCFEGLLDGPELLVAKQCLHWIEIGVGAQHEDAVEPGILLHPGFVDGKAVFAHSFQVTAIARVADQRLGPALQCASQTLDDGFAIGRILGLPGLSGILCMGGIIGKKERCDAPEERAQYSQCVAG